jgi:ABC-type transporter Mla subunit MlaD
MGSSQVQQLKQSLSAFSRTTDRASQTLRQQGKEYDRTAQQLLALIGGSATGKDREVASAVQAASRAVKEASQALQRASSTARSYGSSI